MHTFFDRAERPDPVWYFARRKSGYMMRSEKRAKPGQSGSGRHPSPKRKKAGFFYSLLTLLLSLILWPVGMILLWRRKLRWTVSTKLLTSIITLFVTFTVSGYLLTVPTDNVQVTKAQDTINDFLDNGAEYIADGYTAICDGAGRVSNSASDLGDALSRTAMVTMADAIDQGAELTSSAKETVGGWVENMSKPTEAPTEEPAATDSPTATPTAEPTATPTAEPTPEVTGEGDLPLTVPDVTPDPESAQGIGNGTLSRAGEFVEVTPSPTPTAEPTATPTVEPTEAPAASPEVTAENSVTPGASATAEVTAAPTATAESTATPEPTATTQPTASPEVPEELKPVAPDQAIVYYTSNGGWYHMAETCKSMSNAKPHLLTEALARGLKRCNTCAATEASVLELENAVWTDEASLFHLDPECASFAGRYGLLELDEALSEGFAPCADCRADAFMSACGRTLPTSSPAPTATVEPTAEPTAEPEAAQE